MKLSPLVDVSRERVSTAGDKVIVDYCYGDSRFMLCRLNHCRSTVVRSTRVARIAGPRVEIIAINESNKITAT